ncbi:hypothetical protein E2493_04210 [Sphingomonas parva]|uniref:Biopolymer transporter ExbD n=1 Tax=Sphingomonas parva TaxID=2555898 RepID=A0A4Y8ZVA3_9SPHN|nr:hypothetical protein [Sphingomonas parva]TFI59407.1 hypothetical protein E2493_04210 [Sphingomonas parva]
MIVIAALLAFAVPAAPLRVSDLESTFEVTVAPGRSGCTIAFDRRRFDRQGYEEELARFVRKRGATRAVVRSDRRTPLLCLQDVVEALTRAGVRDVSGVEDEPR